MNQDKYPGVYAAMGEMESRRHECPPMGEMDMRRYERPMGEMDMRRYERPINEMQTRRPEYFPMEEAGIRYQENMGCIDREQVIEDPQLAHAYVPIQKFCPTFAPMTALRKGTVFPGLVYVYGWEGKEFGGENL